MARHTDIDKDYGEPIKYDPTFKGPLHRRSCTDVICLLLFIVFLVAWAAVSGFAIVNGDVRKLLVPTDTIGRKCGLDSGVEDKPYLVFFDMTKCLLPTVPVNGCNTRQVCVKKCPQKTVLGSLVGTVDMTDLNTLKTHIVCTPETNLNDITSISVLKDYLDDVRCAKNIFESKSIIGRCFGDLSALGCDKTGKSSLKTSQQPVDVCVPGADKIADRMISRTTALDTYIGLILAGLAELFSAKKESKEMGTMIIEDLVALRWWIVLGLVFVMLICIIYIALMRWIAAPIVWLSILGIIALLSFSIYLTYVQYKFYKDNPVQLVEGQSIEAITKSIFAQKDTWLVLLIAACITLFIILLMLIFLRKRIVLAIALIKEGSKAVGSVKSSLFFPVFPWIFQVLTLALAVVVCLYLSSIGQSVYRVVDNNTNDSCLHNCNVKNGDPCEPKSFFEVCSGTSLCPTAICHFGGIANPKHIYVLQAVNIVGFFWLIFFIQGLGEMILAGTFATWYWTFNKSDVPFFTLTTSILRAFRYNLGTVAFGSLIITICRLIRLCLEYIDHKIKKYDNVITRAILCCLMCFFKCLEAFLRFINKNAYIMCAVHGKPFFSSAKDAFSLLMRNIVRVFVLDKVTDFLFFLSKLLVAVGCGAIAYYSLTTPAIYKLSGEEPLHYALVPPIIIGVVAYLIASIFFSVYSMAVDTLFLCFLEDCERNDGTPDKPYFMSKQLMKIFGKKNKWN